MGTVPTPADHAASTVLTYAETHSWFLAQALLLKPPACRVNTNAILSTSAGVPLTILFGAETLDQVQTGDTEMHSTATNTERITIRTAGRYDVVAVAQITAAGANSVAIAKNGTPVSQLAYNAPGGQHSATYSDSISCAVGDYLTLVITTTAAGTVATAWPCSLYAKWVSI